MSSRDIHKSNREIDSTKSEVETSTARTAEPESTTVDKLVLALEASIKRSKIASDTDSIPEWNHLKTGIARYSVFREKDPDFSREELQGLNPELSAIKLHFREDKEVSAAIGKLEKGIEEEIQNLAGTKPRKKF